MTGIKESEVENMTKRKPLNVTLQELKWLVEKEGGVGELSPIQTLNVELKGDEEKRLIEKGIYKDGVIATEYLSDLVPMLDPDKIAYININMPTNHLTMGTVEQGDVGRTFVGEMNRVEIDKTDRVSEFVNSLMPLIVTSIDDFSNDAFILQEFDFLCFLEILSIEIKNRLTVEIGGEFADAMPKFDLTVDRVVEGLSKDFEEKNKLQASVWEYFYSQRQYELPEGDELREAVEKSLKSLVEKKIIEHNEKYDKLFPSLEVLLFADCFAMDNGMITLEYIERTDQKEFLFTNSLIVKGRYGNLAVVREGEHLIMYGIKNAEIMLLIDRFLELDPNFEAEEDISGKKDEDDESDTKSRDEEIRRKRREQLEKMTATEEPIVSEPQVAAQESKPQQQHQQVPRPQQGQQAPRPQQQYQQQVPRPQQGQQAPRPQQQYQQQVPRPQQGQQAPRPQQQYQQQVPRPQQGQQAPRRQQQYQQQVPRPQQGQQVPRPQQPQQPRPQQGQTGGQPAQKFCPTCGNPYRDGAKFCAKCGRQF